MDNKNKVINDRNGHFTRTASVPPFTVSKFLNHAGHSTHDHHDSELLYTLGLLIYTCYAQDVMVQSSDKSYHFTGKSVLIF